MPLRSKPESRRLPNTTAVLSVILLLIALLAAVGCGDDATTTTASGTEGTGSGTTAVEAEETKSGSGEPIKIGALHDLSGAFAPVGIQKLHGIEMAVDEINKAGGVLGRQIEIVAPDAQSDIKRYQELARKLILEDEVDVLMAGYTSASREAVRPVADQFKKLYFYNTDYEGGVADHYTFIMGVTPEHQWETVVPWMIEKFGPKIYVAAADYNFGTISADWIAKIAKENGGEVVGEEFIPLDNSSYSSTIQRIQQAKPDWIVPLMVGQKQAAFFAQWGSSGMAGKIPMASSIAMSEGYEHKQFTPPALVEMYASHSFFEELPTDAAKEFVRKWYERWPEDKYVGTEGEMEYTGVYLWAQAVERAGTTETEAVIKAFETGEPISFDAPSGKVTVQPETHHTIRDVWLARSDLDHNISFPNSWQQIVPKWLIEEKGVDLTKKHEFVQYTP